MTQTSYQGLGRALLHLRNVRGLKQHEVAHAAGITKAMLSSYENDATMPSMASLLKVLGGMEADFGDLAGALAEVNGVPPPPSLGQWNLSRETRAALTEASGALARFFDELQRDLTKGGE